MDTDPISPHHPRLTDVQQLRVGLWRYLRKRAIRWKAPEGRKLPQEIDQARDPFLRVADVDMTDLRGIVEEAGVQREDRGVHYPVYALIRDAVHELVLAGILRPSHAAIHAAYDLTYYGLQRLQADDDALTSDPHGVADAFLREFGQVDRADLLARYLGQASRCTELGMELAGATMIGCAYELAVVQLADAVVGKWPDFRVGDLSRDNKKTLESFVEVRKAVANGERPPRAPGAATLFDAVHNALMEARKVTPPPLYAYEDWIRVTCPASFAYVREIRNDAGHPSGHKVELDDLRDHVSRFIRDYRRVRGIIDALSGP